MSSEPRVPPADPPSKAGGAPFVLDADATRQSHWHGRLVVPMVCHPDTSRRLCEALGRLPGVVVATPSTGLFSAGINRIWADYQWVHHMGPSLMAAPGDFLRLLRRLCDGILDAAAGDAKVLVDCSPDYRRHGHLIRSIYPDALVVDLETGADIHAAAVEISRFASSPPARVAASPAVAEPARTSSELKEGLERLVVILGAARSGTTLLQALLMAHSEVGGLDRAETWLFEQISPLWENFLSGNRLSVHMSRAHLARLLRQFCDGMFRSALEARGRGETCFVEKTPAHCWRLDQIAASYPEAWFIHLVRSGYEVATSIVDYRYSPISRLGEAARYWRAAEEAVAGAAPILRRYREVRYEQLVADPVSTVRDLFAWMGLPDEAGLASELGLLAAQRIEASEPASSAVPCPGRRPGLPTRLSRADVARVHAGAGPALVRLGYASRREAWSSKAHPAYALERLRGPLSASAAALRRRGPRAPCRGQPVRDRSAQPPRRAPRDQR